jgi:hypothetical protein
MGQTLTLTNSMYLECTSLTASALPNTQYDVIAADPNADRRIYSIMMSSTDANTQNIRFFLNDGTLPGTASSYVASFVPLTANSGNTISIGPVDVLGRSTNLALFAKRADTTGAQYLNLPKNWSIKALYTGIQPTAPEAITFVSHGEKYGSTSHVFTSKEFEQTVILTNATGTTETTLLSSSVYDRRLYTISATTTDSTARTLAIKLKSGSNSYLLYTTSVLANSGNSTIIRAHDIFEEPNGFSGPIFQKTYETDGGFYFNLPAGWSITGTLASPPAIGSTITVKSSGDTYE